MARDLMRRICPKREKRFVNGVHVPAMKVVRQALPALVSTLALAFVMARLSLKAGSLPVRVFCLLLGALWIYAAFEIYDAYHQREQMFKIFDDMSPGDALLKCDKRPDAAS